MSNETISLGSCKTCGAPAQFLEDGTTRHVDIKQDEIDHLRAELEQSEKEKIFWQTAHGECKKLRERDRERVRELEEVLKTVRAGVILMRENPGPECPLSTKQNIVRRIDNALTNSEKED